MARARRYIGHAVSAPGANTDIFTAITPLHNGSYIDVSISLATASIVDIRVTDGSTAYSQAVLDGATLSASTRYDFSFLAPRVSAVAGSTTLTYSLRVRTDSVIQSIVVDEVHD